MTLAFIPPWVAPDAEDYDLVDDTISVFRPQLAPGISQRQSFGSPRWKIFRRHTVRQEELSTLLAALMDSDGMLNTIVSRINWIRRGSFPALELVTNNQFAGGTTSWTSSNAEVVLSSADRILRATRSGGINDVTVRAASFTTVSAVVYGARAFVRAGRDNSNMALRLGTTAGGSELVTGSASSGSTLLSVSAAATGTTTHFSIMDDNAGKGNGSFSEIMYTSVGRVPLLNGASQAGSAVVVDALPVSTNGLLLPFDWVSINGELKMVTAALNSDSSGNGYLRFRPALFETPADNTPVYVLDPMGMFLVSDLKVMNKFGSEAIVTYSLEEVFHEP